MEKKSIGSNTTTSEYISNCCISDDFPWNKYSRVQPSYMFDKSQEFNGTRLIDSNMVIDINGHTFRNVDKVLITERFSPSNTYDPITTLYYNDSVGILKRETVIDSTDFQSWSIVRWKVYK